MSDSAIIAVEAASVGPDAWARGAAAPGVAAVGRVIEHEPGAAHLAGLRVLVGRFAPCGECDVCRRGGASVCPTSRTIAALGDAGGRLAAPARWLVPLDGALAVPGPAAALLGFEAALAYALYARASVAPREPTVVIGDDAVARLLREVLIAKHAPPLIEPVRPDDDAAAVRARLGEAVAAAGHGARPWRIFETTGGAAGRALALALSGPRATVTLAAPPGASTGSESGGAGRGPAWGPRRDPAPTPVDVADAVAREVTVIGVAGAHPDLLTEVAALAVRGELDLAGAAEVVARDQLATAWARRAGARPATALIVTYA